MAVFPSLTAPFPAAGTALLGAIGDLPPAYYLAPVGALLALAMAFVFNSSVLKRSEGDSEMARIAQYVRQGAMAYLRRQYKVVGIVFIGLIVFLGLMTIFGLQDYRSLIGVPIAGFLSGLAGWFGMKMATNASARTAFAAKESLNDGLTVAFRSGAVMGLVVVGFALLDVSVWFMLFNAGVFGDVPVTELTTIMLSFGMGASTQALFARVGGGIYTKAADVGADLVGKVEAGIPEDDARNPATIADNVGDNVGDVAGMGADLYESYYGSILATMALGAAAAFTVANIGDQTDLALALASAPLALAGAGIICSIIGVFTVRAQENASFSQLLKGLHLGVYVASTLIVLATFGLFYLIFGGGPGVALEGVTTWWRLGFAIVAGLAAGLVIANATEYYTSYEHPPTKRIARQALTGPATVIISGIAEGMKSTWASLLTVVVAIIAAFALAGGGENFLMGLYGVGIAAVGMLSTLGITLATDAYGPIADNAGGNAEMTHQPPFVRERTDMLDSLGNTTAATGKGFAIGSAALTALALFAAYIQVVQTQITTQAEDYIDSGGYLETRDMTELGFFAVYQGHGKFAVVTGPLTAQEGEDVEGGVDLDTDALVDGAIFVAQTAEPEARRAVAHFPAGSVVDVITPDGGDPEAPGWTGYEATLLYQHGDHEHAADIRLVSSRRGSIADVLAFYDVTLANPKLLGGVFIGVMLAFLFCALTMNAVGRAAYAMIDECRRQFGKIREALRAQGKTDEEAANPDNWPSEPVDYQGTSYPDYQTCVSISTAGAQREMILPAVLAITIPVAVGLVLNVPGVMGMLAGGLTAGFALAVFMANAGGAWDNAKKLLESYPKISADAMIDDADLRERVPEEIREQILAKANDMRAAGQGDEMVYGKGSDDHKATVVGDTVGDPFKDTSGPSLNILIKLISIVSVVFAGLIVKLGPIIGSAIGIG